MIETKTLKNIVILSPAHPLRGGIASSTERLAQELQSMGYGVSIWSFKLQYPSWLFPGKTQYAEGPAPEDLDIREEIISINPFNWIKVGRLLGRRRPDLVIVRYWLPFMAPALGTISRIARANGHTRVIAIADNVIPHERRPGDRLLTRYFIGSADGFIVLSKSVEEDIRKFSATKPIVYVPHPIYDNYGPKVDRESALNHLQLPLERRYLLFFGFIRYYKGLDLLLEALADERLIDLGIWLIVAGEFYEDPAPYLEIIRRHGLKERVFIHDAYVPNEEVKYYFGAADLVVQPYRSATQSGISQMAYHFEKPMLVTRVGGLPEIVEHGAAGYVVEVEVSAIADAIHDFFRNDRRQEMIKGVKEHKKKFSWSRMVEGIQGVFAAVGEEGNRQ